MEGVLPVQESEDAIEPPRSNLKLSLVLFWVITAVCLLFTAFFLLWPSYQAYQEQKQFEAEEARLASDARQQALYFGQIVEVPWEGVIQPFCSNKVWVYEDFEKKRPIEKFCNVDHGEFTITDTFAAGSIPVPFIRIAWKNETGGFDQGNVAITEIVMTDGVEVFTFFMPKFGPDGQETQAARQALTVWQRK